MFILLATVAFILNISSIVRPTHHPIEFARDCNTIYSLASEPHSEICLISYVKTLVFIDLVLISHVNPLASHVSRGGILALISHFKTLSFRVSGGKDLALISHVKTLAFRDLTLISHFKTLNQVRPVSCHSFAG